MSLFSYKLHYCSLDGMTDCVCSWLLGVLRGNHNESIFLNILFKFRSYNQTSSLRKVAPAQTSRQYAGRYVGVMRLRGVVVTMPGYESVGPGSILAWAVSTQLTQLFIHPIQVGQ